MPTIESLTELISIDVNWIAALLWLAGFSIAVRTIWRNIVVPLNTAMHSIGDLVRQVRALLDLVAPNGGSSLGDAISRTDRRVALLARAIYRIAENLGDDLRSGDALFGEEMVQTTDAVVEAIVAEFADVDPDDVVE